MLTQKGDGKSGKRLLFANHDTRGYGKEHGVNHHSLSWCQRKAQVQVIFDTDTFWLSQQRMAELFGVTVPTINYHLDQIDKSGEIHLSDAIRKIRIPSDKWSGEVLMYNLDVVIAVGYRVNSYEATQFRIWATGVLKEYLKKGFVLDDERLKGKNVLERIILMICWSVFVRYVPLSAGIIKR